MVVEMEHKKCGRIRVTGIPIKLSDTPGFLTLPPPTLGEHNFDILSGLLGYSEVEIEALRSQGAI
jgi:crotonobetainyl-CoA:carnitine CoA-transferase CaiB-like acyl-CoA transferase